MVYPYLKDLSYYEGLGEVVFCDHGNQVFGGRVSRVRQAGERILLQLQGMSSWEAVQPLLRCDVCVPRRDVPPPGLGEFYWFDLEGLEVLTQEGEFLGRVVDFFPTGSNEVLVVRHEEREVLLPFIKDVILSIDQTQGCVRVRTLPGLL
jgi:16S rRNA processing protein RimM